MSTPLSLASVRACLAPRLPFLLLFAVAILSRLPRLVNAADQETPAHRDLVEIRVAVGNTDDANTVNRDSTDPCLDRLLQFEKRNQPKCRCFVHGQGALDAAGVAPRDCRRILHGPGSPAREGPFRFQRILRTIP